MRTALLAAATAAILASAGAASAQMPAAADVIRAWDTNGDGAVSKDEWVAAGRPSVSTRSTPIRTARSPPTS